MVGTEWTKEVQDEIREEKMAAVSLVMQGIVSHCKNLGFDSEGDGTSWHYSGTIWLAFWLVLFGCCAKNKLKGNDKSRELVSRLNTIIQVAGDCAKVMYIVVAESAFKPDRSDFPLCAIPLPGAGSLSKGHYRWMLFTFPCVTKIESYFEICAILDF